MSTVRPVAMALALCAALGLGSCGFKPIYAQNAGVTAQLDGISLEVTSTSARSQYLLRQDLAARVGDNGDALLLRVTVSESRQGFGIRVDNVATRYDLVMFGAYDLVNAETGAVVTSGRASGSSSFDVTDEPYADIAVEEKARERAIALLADAIRREVVFALARADAS